MTTDEPEIERDFCKSCEAKLSGPYCSRCGQARELDRIDRAYVLQEIGSVLNFDKGLLYTIRELFLRPGQSVRQFIQEDRRRLVRPIIFIILCSLVYTLAQQVGGFEDGYINYNFADWKDSALGTIFGWVSTHYGYTNILISVFTAWWIKLLFRAYNYNYYEIFILLCFAMGNMMLLFALFGLLATLMRLPLLQFGANLGILYLCWAVGQFFDKTKKRNYLKAIISYVLGLLSFLLIAMTIGMVIDAILG
ncbi:MAG: DUF3667 domain-containing protein [Bacteroidota bacterium]